MLLFLFLLLAPHRLCVQPHMGVQALTGKWCHCWGEAAFVNMTWLGDRYWAPSNNSLMKADDKDTKGCCCIPMLADSLGHGVWSGNDLSKWRCGLC